MSDEKKIGLCRCINPLYKDLLLEALHVAEFESAVKPIEAVAELRKILKDTPACDTAFLDDALTQEVEDERKASETYHELAQVAHTLGEHGLEQDLKRIASDEARHFGELSNGILTLRGNPAMAARMKVAMAEGDEAEQEAARKRKWTEQVTQGHTYGLEGVSPRHKLTAPEFGTENDWAQLAGDVHNKQTDEQRQSSILEPDATAPEDSDRYRRWLLRKAGELGIT